MASSDKKDVPPKTPGNAEVPTTPYTAPTISDSTAHPVTRDAALHALSERYDILSELGRGGMGAVYRARDRETGDVVALKVLLPEIAAQPDVIQRFKSELLLARKITHKNVCRTYELLRFGDTAVITMEFLEGESLRSLLNRTQGVSIRRGLKILRHVIGGLAEAHSQGVVHRDLKPENILVTRGGEAKVMDFGIAHSLEAKATQTGGLLGTPAYMSPEQAEGKNVDARTDIYALGLIMYEMFAGEPAFHAETPTALLYKQIHEKPAPPRSVDPYLPGFLDRAIEKCLEKDPKKRFQTIAELTAALDEEPVGESSAEEPVPAPHLSAWGRRDWALLTLGVLGLVCFLAFRDTVLPAASKPLEMDSTGARRTAEDLLRKFGIALPHDIDADREFQERLYVTALFPEGPHPEFADVLSKLEFPLLWRVTMERNIAAIEHVPPHYVLINAQGKVRKFSYLNYGGTVVPNYKAPTVEQRREIARQAVESVCGSLPPDLAVVESSGEEQGALYSAAWKPLRPAGRPPIVDVSLDHEKVVELNCDSSSGKSETAELLAMPTFFIPWVRLGLLFGLGVVLFWFFVGQCHQSPILLRRAPLAMLLGVAGVWLLAGGFTQASSAQASGLSLGPAQFMSELVWILGGGIAVAAVMLVALVTAEHYLIRRAPSWVATYRSLWRGKFTEPAVGLAVVRGALAGLAVAGLETGLARFTIFMAGIARLGRFLRPLILLVAPLGDPSGVGQAATSASPVLFVVAASLFCGLVVGVACFGLNWGLKGRKYFDQRGWGYGLIYAISLPWFLILAFHLPFGQFLHAGMGFFFAPVLVLLVLGWVMISYDVLTVVVAIATSVLWTLNYSLLQLFQDLGNGGEWALFIGWGILVAAGVVVANRPQLVHATKRLKDEMQ